MNPSAGEGAVGAGRPRAHRDGGDGGSRGRHRAAARPFGRALQRCGARQERLRSRGSGGAENTHWKLTRLRGRAVVVGEGQGEPHLVLRPERQEANGSGGCNRLFGGYRLEGGRISFSGIATTRMSCPAGMEIEGEFLRALAEAETWKISGPESISSTAAASRWRASRQVERPVGAPNARAVAGPAAVTSARCA